MTDAQKRVYVSDLYSGPHWKKKVEKMPDDQIVAIYLKHINDGQRPEHVEPETQTEPEHLDMHVPRIMHGPHVNEDLFPLI